MEIKTFELECPMCHQKFTYWDTSHVPKTCGSRMCERNYAYQQAHKDQYGNVPSGDEIRKWN